MRRPRPLPKEGRTANVTALRLQRRALSQAHKSTAIIDRRLVLAVAHQIRKEIAS